MGSDKGSAGQQRAWQGGSWEVTDTGVGEASRWSSEVGTKHEDHRSHVNAP